MGGLNKIFGNSIYIGRQPILDREGNIFAYEILYRSNCKNKYPSTMNSVEATAKVIHTTLNNVGVKKLLDGKKVLSTLMKMYCKAIL